MTNDDGYTRILQPAGRRYLFRAGTELTPGPTDHRYTKDADPNYQPRPVGFTANLTTNQEPTT